MKILILGADGYLGWPCAMYFSNKNYSVYCVDNFIKRKLEIENNIKPLARIDTMSNRILKWNKISKKTIKFFYGDLTNHRFVYEIVKKVKADVVIHFGEQPSAPYSMFGREQAVFSQTNNIVGTLNLMFAIKKYNPKCHIIKLGTMGSYGTPNIDIEEGYLNINYKGRRDKILYPFKPHSFYHLSKSADSLNLEFACRVWGLKVTDLNQGVVYGTDTNETTKSHELRTSFHYDHIFGTVINRFILKASIGIPLTIYGEGSQKRTFLNINDSLKCIELAIKNPPKISEYKVRNQFTEVFSIKDIAKKVIKASRQIGLKTKYIKIKNPRSELKKHYYNPSNKSFLKLGLKPILFNERFIQAQIKTVLKFKNNVDRRIIYPSIKWKN